ncbi:DUF3558 family protein [Amycolatopsis azurea]|uniref:DUF3558 domain-containing protein n=1 Tax=Amycolatopsis azurea DSM 43854 TaxID=1238180 RepID=M2PZK2_9PSEU|nr:DUF3558 family protein [Amycolatopsis azurea]EMD30073.1 hypothetical protein C791_0058 [Amycolatopsis azurea DSM 43854]OOC07234.1 DUF3558 domain-containing protein [Amycolatopsis azurea DSM 43854]
MRFRNSLAIGLAVLALGGCTSTIGGTASPVPGQGPVITKAEPCALLTAEQADALGVTFPGKERPAKPERKIPGVCRFPELEDAPEGVALEVSQSKDLSAVDYYAGAQPGEKFGVGGFTWTRYATILGPSYCSLTTELDAKTFIEVSSDAPGGDNSKACDLAKAALPAIASHLPGGQPSGEITAPPGQKPIEPTGPLVNVDPCSLLKPEQAASFNLVAARPMNGSSRDPKNGCQWDDTDGDKGKKALDLWVYTATKTADVPGLEGTPAEQMVNGRKWIVYSASDSPICVALFPITETSSIKLDTGDLSDNAKACEIPQAVMPLVTANAPAA